MSGCDHDEAALRMQADGSLKCSGCPDDPARARCRQECADEIEDWVLRHVGIPVAEHPDSPWCRGVLHAANILRGTV